MSYDLKDFEIQTVVDSPCKRLHFVQNDMKKDWDLIAEPDRVMVVIYNTSSNKLVFVKQFRPAIYYSKIIETENTTPVPFGKYNPEIGITLELCAGVIKSGKSILEAAKDTVLDECCYDVPILNFKIINTNCYNVGVMGNKQTLVYCEVTDSMVTPKGDGMSGKNIEVEHMDVSDVKTLLHEKETNSPPGFFQGVYWFLLNKNSS